jgi:hypothetical protein
VQFGLLLLVTLGLSGCGLLFQENPNPREVQPVKFVPCMEGGKLDCGRLPTTPERADGFVVEVSNRRFYNIVSKYKRTQEFQKRQVEAFGDWAVREVVSRGYCSAAEVPAASRYILSWEGRGERAIYVTCKEQ